MCEEMEEELSLDEETFGRRNEPGGTQLAKRLAFLSYVHQFISTYTETTQVRRFSLSMARPREYENDVNDFIHFAVSRGVKHLVLEFYDNRQERGHAVDPAQGFPLPEQVYDHHQNLQSLKLIWCKFDVLRLRNFKNLEILILACINITTSQLRDLVVSCPILNTLRLGFFRGLDMLHINNTRLKSLEMVTCDLASDRFLLDGPELRRFIYTGKVARFHMGDTSQLVQARLDFGAQLEFLKEPHLYELLDQLDNVRFMTICSVFLQMIPSGEHHYRAEKYLKVEHLTMNTGLHLYEFIGIKFMLASCPRMTTLTLCLRNGRIFHNYIAPYEITSPVDFWREPLLVAPCVRESLQVLNVHGFLGTPHQLAFIEYIIRYGSFLASVNLYLPEEQHDANFMRSIRGKASQLKRMHGANPYSKVLVFIPLSVSVD